MKGKRIEQLLAINFPVMIEDVDDGFEVWHPDFGKVAMLVWAPTVDEAIKELKEMKDDLIHFFVEKGIPIPEPNSIVKKGKKQSMSNLLDSLIGSESPKEPDRPRHSRKVSVQNPDVHPGFLIAS